MDVDPTQKTIRRVASLPAVRDSVKKRTRVDVKAAEKLVSDTGEAQPGAEEGLEEDTPEPKKRRKVVANPETMTTPTPSSTRKSKRKQLLKPTAEVPAVTGEDSVPFTFNSNSASVTPVVVPATSIISEGVSQMAPVEEDGVLKVTAETLLEMFAETKNWESAALFTPYEGKWRKAREEMPLLLMRFFAGPKLGTRFGKYNFMALESVAAFWIEQLGYAPAMIRHVYTQASGGRLWEITLQDDLSTEGQLEKLPRDLVKLAPGMGFVLTLPSRSIPSAIPVAVDPLPVQFAEKRVAKLVAKAFNDKVALQSPLRVFHHGIASAAVLGSLKVSPDLAWGDVLSLEPDLRTDVQKTLLRDPSLMEPFSLPVKLDGYPTKIYRRTACTICAEVDHVMPHCPVYQRLMASDMPIHVFTKSQKKVVRAEEEGPEPSSSKKVGGKELMVEKSDPKASEQVAKGGGKEAKKEARRLARKAKGRAKGKGKA